MSVRSDQAFKNPSPGLLVLTFILALIVLTLGDISARAGRADAWVILCGQCESRESTVVKTHTSAGAFRDVPNRSR